MGSIQFLLLPSRPFLCDESGCACLLLQFLVRMCAHARKKKPRQNHSFLIRNTLFGINVQYLPRGCRRMLIVSGLYYVKCNTLCVFLPRVWPSHWRLILTIFAWKACQKWVCLCVCFFLIQQGDRIWFVCFFQCVFHKGVLTLQNW